MPISKWIGAMQCLLLTAAIFGISLVLATNEGEADVNNDKRNLGSSNRDYAFRDYIMNHPDMVDWRTVFSKRADPSKRFMGSESRFGESGKGFADLMQNWSKTFGRNARSFGIRKGFNGNGDFGSDRFQTWQMFHGSKRFRRDNSDDMES